jgi:hypothetical protein
MASVQEIVDNLLPGELIRLNNYPFFSADAFEKYLLAQGQIEVDETEISYWNQKSTAVRPFTIDNSVRFNPAAIKMASKDEIRNSSVSLPTRFLDEDSGLFYVLDADDTTTPDNGFTIVSTDLKRYKPKVDYVTPEMFHAGGINWFSALQSAFNQGLPVLLVGTYEFTGHLSLPTSTGVVVRGQNRKSKGVLKPIGDSNIINLWANNSANILKEAKFENLKVDLTGCTATHFFLFDGIQHCTFNDLLFTGGTTNPIQLQFAYFNTLKRIQCENTATGIKLFGTTFSNSCNFNDLSHITLNNLTGTGIRLDFARGNTLEHIDAEYGQTTGIGTAIHLQDSKHNVIRGFWYEAVNAIAIHDPALVIDGLNSSNNNANLVEESGQILHKYTAIRVTTSNNVTLQRLLFNSCTVAIQESGNSNLKIGHNIYETVALAISLASNDTYIYDTTNTNKKRINNQYVIDSDQVGSNGLVIKQAGNNRLAMLTDNSGNTTLTVYDGSNAATTLGRLLGTGGFELRTWMQFFAAVTAASVGNHTLFRDSADQKLKYKDGSGVVQLLY